MNTKQRDVLFGSILIFILVIRFYSVIYGDVYGPLIGQVGDVSITEGRIITEPQKKDFIQTFTIETDEGVNIKVGADKYNTYTYGDRVRVYGKLSRPRNFTSNGGRVFDYINYLRKDDIYYEYKKARVDILERSGIYTVSGKLFFLKRKFLNNLNSVLGEPHAGLAGGLVVGDKASLGKDIIDDFRRSGLIHIVVLSGYNITIIATSIRRILGFLPRNAGIILGAIGIICFGILVGGGATVVRSCIMAIIALCAELFRREYNVGRALLIAGVLMLIQNPLILFYDPSFQLSFLATLGLVALSTPFEKKLGFITEKMGIRALVASTCATQVFVSPLIFYMMGQLSIIGIFVNIIVLPFIPLTMLLVFISGFLGFFSHTLSLIAGWGSHILLSYELFIVKVSAELPFAVLEIPAFSGWIVLGFYTIYIALFLKLPSMVSQFIFEKKSST